MTSAEDDEELDESVEQYDTPWSWVKLFKYHLYVWKHSQASLISL